MAASSLWMTSLRSRTRYPSGTWPPIQRPLRLDATILSRMRSPVTSRSNWAKESSTFKVSRPMLVVVLKAWVTEIVGLLGQFVGTHRAAEMALIMVADRRCAARGACNSDGAPETR